MKKLSPQIMGILNVSPDSFYDGGCYTSVDAALQRADQMIAEGADIIDIGGEASGPRSKDVDVQEEMWRVIPVVKELASRKHAPIISVDTYKSEVARRAIEAGATIINDVTALRGDPKMAAILAENDVRVVLMYAKDASARTTRTKKRYKDVVKTIGDFLEERVNFAVAQGIKRKNIILDPGMGAFVSGEPKYSYEILLRLGELKRLGLPILIGTSRKSFLPGPLEERLGPTLATSMYALMNAATMIRVHDVREHRGLVDGLVKQGLL